MTKYKIYIKNNDQYDFMSSTLLSHMVEELIGAYLKNNPDKSRQDFKVIEKAL